MANAESTTVGDPASRDTRAEPASRDTRAEPAWSYSTLTAYETCPRRYEAYSVLKTVREPETTELREGQRLHTAFERRIKEGAPLPLGMGQHEGMLARIASAAEHGAEVVGEQRLALTREFQGSEYFGERVWFRTVVDAGVIWPDRASIFDWKTGKPKEDATQLLLMAATLMCQRPEITSVTAALVFVKHGHVERVAYQRSDLPRMWASVLPRVRVLQEARGAGRFPPKPSGLCKRYCAVETCEYHGGRSPASPTVGEDAS